MTTVLLLSHQFLAFGPLANLCDFLLPSEGTYDKTFCFQFSRTVIPFCILEHNWTKRYKPQQLLFKV